MKSSAELYEVDRLVGKRVVDGCVQYKVRWADYSSRDDTWEPKGNIPGDVVDLYEEERRGKDSREYNNVARE